MNGLPASPSGKKISDNITAANCNHFLLKYGAVNLLTRKQLISLGYDVTATTSSREALKLFAASPHGFDLVITDQMMPHMTGTELSRKLIAIRPDMPIILLTGFSHTLMPAQARKASGSLP